MVLLFKYLIFVKKKMSPNFREIIYMNINEMTEMIINLAHMSKRHDGSDHFSLLQYAYFKLNF